MWGTPGMFLAILIYSDDVHSDFGKVNLTLSHSTNYTNLGRIQGHSVVNGVLDPENTERGLCGRGRETVGIVV